MKYPEYRIAQRESGMKPISYLQHLLKDCLEIRREKGIYWVSGVNGTVDGLAVRKMNFYMTAVGIIRQKLTDAGIDEAVANEIAGICMRSDTGTEPRKEIHSLLCRQFGNKIGAKYYRQAVKYVCI